MSQPQSSSSNEELVRWDEEKEKAQSEYARAVGADQMTVEEREDERESISLARPGGEERVLNEQRIRAEGIGAAKGHLREQALEDAAVKDISAGEYAGERGGPREDAR